MKYLGSYLIFILSVIIACTAIFLYGFSNGNFPNFQLVPDPDLAASLDTIFGTPATLLGTILAIILAITSIKISERTLTLDNQVKNLNDIVSLRDMTIRLEADYKSQISTLNELLYAYRAYRDQWIAFLDSIESESRSSLARHYDSHFIIRDELVRDHLFRMANSMDHLCDIIGENEKFLAFDGFKRNLDWKSYQENQRKLFPDSSEDVNVEQLRLRGFSRVEILKLQLNLDEYCLIKDHFDNSSLEVAREVGECFSKFNSMDVQDYVEFLRRQARFVRDLDPFIAVKILFSAYGGNISLVHHPKKESLKLPYQVNINGIFKDENDDIKLHRGKIDLKEVTEVARHGLGFIFTAPLHAGSGAILVAQRPELDLDDGEDIELFVSRITYFDSYIAHYSHVAIQPKYGALLLRIFIERFFGHEAEGMLIQSFKADYRDATIFYADRTQDAEFQRQIESLEERSIIRIKGFMRNLYKSRQTIEHSIKSELSNFRYLLNIGDVRINDRRLKCLVCDEVFASRGMHHRVCSNCKETHAPQDYPFVIRNSIL